MKRMITLTVAIAALGIASAAVASGCDGGVKSTAASHADTKAATILATAESAGFTTLVAAVKAAGLEETLAGKGPFTVFAPTDEAFAALPEGTLESLLNDKEALTAVLLHHVVAGSVMAADVVELETVKTAGGTELAIKAGKDVMVGGAKVVMADVAASNGVIHVIDTVLVP